MEIEIGDVEERIRFEVKLQISLYETAKKVIVEERKNEFEKYMEERKEKIRELLGGERAKIYENGKLIFEV